MNDRLRLRFEKKGRASYISHLDLMRTLQRAFSRAGYKLRYSEGFNPHAKISILLPLSIGTDSECEFLDFFLAEDAELTAMPAVLNHCLPEGITACEVYPAPGKGAELKWLEVEGRFTDTDKDAEFFSAFFRREELPVLRRTKRGERMENIAPFIYASSFENTPDGVKAEFTLSAQNPSINPELCIQALGEAAPGYFKFTRKECFFENMRIFR